MKAGWETRALGEVCKVIGGGTPSKDNAAFYSGDIPWATVRDMRQDVITTTECSVTREAIKSSATNIIPSGNVVIATRVGLGKVCLLGQDTAINQDLRGIVPISTKTLSVRFLYWWLKDIADLIIAEGTGATVQGVKLPFVKSLQIPLPPLPEQHRIVAILDKAFDGIAKAKAAAEANLQNARAVFESHLQEVFTRRGDGWVETTLDKASEIVNGFAFKSEDFSPLETVKCIKITNVGVKTFVTESDSYLPTRFMSQQKAVSVDAGNIVIALTRSIISAGLKIAIVPKDYDGALVNQRVAAIKPHPNVALPVFLYSYLSTQAVVDYVKARVNTLMQPNLSIVDLRSMPIPLPSLEIQKEICRKLNQLNAQTQHLESLYQRKIAALDELKKSLLHQAFSGAL